MLPSRVIDRLSRQEGVIARPELVNEMGYSKGTVEGWVSRRHLVVVRYEGTPLAGTYRAAGAVESPKLLLMAAVSRCRPKAWLSGAAALGVLGFEGYSARDAFVILVPPGRSVSNVPFEVFEDPFMDQHRSRLGALPITTPTRSIVEASRWVRGKRLRTTVDYALWRKLVRLPELRVCALAAGHEGARELVEMIDEGVFDLDSEGERQMAPLLTDLAPPPLWQHWVASSIRVDCLLADVPLILEYLGDVAHGRGHQREHDHARTRKIERLGYHVEEVTADDLKQPEVFKSRILGIRMGLLAAGARHPTE
ncbi:MAG TPA: hypothetical protein VM287_01755 [Egibacteraceae bacterium]|nr:hypothetical protein [Egibacteraceae bacterium]